MKQILAITRKELSNYFSSPLALIFLGVFLVLTLAFFFWVDAFFARGIADVRSLFRWMPLLMIFLVSALTMRQWSEEQQTGTLEILLTLPVRAVQLVLGKFLAVVALVAVALGLTLFIPFTVGMLGNLDLGPVVGGYLAALLMAAAYTAIGLYLSSRTDNQIVALILTVITCGAFYLLGVGAETISGLAGGLAGALGLPAAATSSFTAGVTAFLRALATGSRFESIERGVLDLRDLVYYLSLAAVFLALNVLSLDSKRWSGSEHTQTYRRNLTFTVVLLALNLIALNGWLYPLSNIRLDMTARKEYSLSQTTRDLLSNIQEPLLIRGYFSEKTHPKLAPLIPQIEDTLREYQIASGGKVTIEIVDPARDPDKEAEANQTYGITPVPFQVTERYEASVLNSYFDILIRYGDQNEVLNFRDLIEVQPYPDGSLDVRLRNLEYDLTRSIKKVVYGFQSIDAVLASLSAPAKLTLYATPNTLPDGLKDAPAAVKSVADKLAQESNGKFSFEMIDPDASQSPANREYLQKTYNLQPIAVSLFSPDSYYLHIVLQAGDQTQLLYPGGDLSEAGLRTAIESSLKRASSGFLKVVGLWRPQQQPTQDMFGQMQQPISSWQYVAQQLGQDYEVRPLTLDDGQVPADVDMLLVIAPQQMTDLQQFAIDQYLMRGGAVVIAAGNYGIAPDQFTGNLALQPLSGTLNEMLLSYGVDVPASLVLDPQNEPFPVPVTRNAGGFQIQELQALNYPPFVDVRSDGMAANNPMVSGLSAVTLHWASPVRVDETKNANRTVTTLLQSSKMAWLRTDTNIQPDMEKYPDYGFPVEGSPQAYPLAVSIQGSFESFFKGKDVPQPAVPADGQTPPATAPVVGVIENSPDTARLVVIGSSEFLDDTVFKISSQLSGDRYLNNLQLAQNVADWSVEDFDLLSIRNRGGFTRVLKDMRNGEQVFWETANYLFVLLALAAIGMVWSMRRRNEQPIQLLPQSDTVN